MPVTEYTYGAIEAGGTKFMCAVGTQDGRILDQTRIQTRDPETTLEEVCSYLSAAGHRVGRLQAVGIASFGPLDLEPSSPTFGYITRTPKVGWSDCELAGRIRRRLDCPVYLDTDVNGAALGELHWGAARGLSSVVYVTVGTGIGVGAVHNGLPIHGLMHPEMGHIYVKRHPQDASFNGICPFHGDCLEGLANGPAVLARTGKSLAEATAEDPIWTLEADYLGQLCANLVLSHSPQRIILGGGLMHERLYAQTHDRMLFWLGNYPALPQLHRADYLSPPGLDGLSGIKGALWLATAKQ